MSRGILALSGAGGLLGLYGAYELIQGTQHSGWFWLFLGAAILFLAQIQVVQHALQERNEARTARDQIAREAQMAPQRVIHEDAPMPFGRGSEIWNEEMMRARARRHWQDALDLED